MDEVPKTSGPSVALPRYVKFTVLLIGIIALVFVFIFARPILVPFMFSVLLAMLLNPAVQWMGRRGVHNTLAIGIAVIISVAAIGGLGYFIVTQAMNFSEALPEMEKKMEKLWGEGERWAQGVFDMRGKEMDKAIENVKKDGMEKSGSFIGRTLTTVGALFAYMFLLPVFTFLVLYYKRLFLEFLQRAFPEKDHAVLNDVLFGTKGVVQSYLVGLLFEAAIVATLNWIGLTVIGVRYALMLAVLGALLNLIPYIGMIIATLIPMTIALTLQNVEAAFWVLALYAAVQFIDNNFIVPVVVASRVQLNALISILAVMFGGLVWAIPGMFLAIPFTAILKVVCDRVPGLKPLGYVMGTTKNDDHHRLFRLGKLRSKKNTSNSR